MNREEASNIWQIIKAYGEGKTIQFRQGGEWFDYQDNFGDFRCGLTYRIKPKENYIIEQNCGENRVEGGVLSVSASVSDVVEVCSTCVNRRNCPYPNYQHKCEHYLEEKLYVVKNEREKLEIRLNLADGFTSETRASIPVLFRGTLAECSKFVQNYEEMDEKHYRPFEDTAELMVHYSNHFNIDFPPFYEPIIWVKNKSDDTRYLLTGFKESHVLIRTSWFTMKDLFRQCVFLDGSPIGKLEE